MSKLSALTQAQLDRCITQAQLTAPARRLPEHIPLLANPNRCHEFAVQVRRVEQQVFSVAAAEYRFPLMSLIKPFVLLCVLQQPGYQRVFHSVDMKPSEHSFNSLAQLEIDQSKPRNPMINSGAIARVLSQAGYVDSVEAALDTYQQICCLSGTVEDLTKLGLLLAKPQIHLEPTHQRTVNALMMTCGLYEDSGIYAVQIGLPMKSGVSGGLLAIIPAAGAIACYSPPLDQAGNSVTGLFLVKQLAQTFNLSVFN